MYELRSTYLVDDSLVVLGREHEVDDGPDHPRLRPGVAPRQQGVQVVLRFQDVVHLAIPRHQADSDDAPLLHVCFYWDICDWDIAIGKL